MRCILALLLLLQVSLSLGGGFSKKTATKTHIKSLPGLTGSPGTNHYSGFIEVDPESGSHLYYYYVESQSNPGTDPLMWWMNGGPGASKSQMMTSSHT